MKHVKIFLPFFFLACMFTGCEKKYTCLCIKNGTEYKSPEEYKSKSKAEEGCRNKTLNGDTCKFVDEY